jgi:hypothetical protein
MGVDFPELLKVLIGIFYRLKYSGKNPSMDYKIINFLLILMQLRGQSLYACEGGSERVTLDGYVFYPKVIIEV